ncbi:MAG: DUF86 domain-containing protein [bacterium]|nr:DUF86 domain-containing protein [bacterium]
MAKDIQILLGYILDSVEELEKHVTDLSHEDFLQSTLVQDAVMRRLEIIGEAVNNLPDKLKADNSEIPWRDIADMRNLLIHEYFGVDIELVWETVQKDIPPLKKKIQELQK